ncbi:MAG: CHC2 zinc finger domain-containing protein, partial [Desulfobacteraceae bacterium]|nr:CHC2 zinc finger domain-containing protein [Desulfobacteraceae bacterium]
MTIFIPEDKVLEIKNAADIVEVVSESVLLKKTGKNYVGLCPFHSEKTPSFTVSPQKQIFYCFGCAAGGNVFSFIMKRDGISFPEAARILSRQYGINIPVQTMSKEQKRLRSERENLLTVNRQAMEFFQSNLFNASLGKQAL